MPETKAKYLDAVREMVKAQNIYKKKGIRKKFYLADPEAMKEYSTVINFRVNPQQRDSKASDEEDVRQKIAGYRTDPINIDQRAVSKMQIKMNNDDVDELLAKPQTPPVGVPSEGVPNPPPSPPAWPELAEPPGQIQLSQPA